MQCTKDSQVDRRWGAPTSAALLLPMCQVVMMRRTKDGKIGERPIIDLPPRLQEHVKTRECTPLPCDLCVHWLFCGMLERRRACRRGCSSWSRSSAMHVCLSFPLPCAGFSPAEQQFYEAIKTEAGQEIRVRITVIGFCYCTQQHCI